MTNRGKSTSPDQLAYTIEQVAALLATSKRSVERAIGSGVLASVKMIGGIRITRAQLDAYFVYLELQSGFKRPKRL